MSPKRRLKSRVVRAPLLTGPARIIRPTPADIGGRSVALSANRDFHAAANDPPYTQHKWLPMTLQAELLWNQKYSDTLLKVIVAYGASVEAKNAKIAALEARLARMKRYMRVRRHI